MCHNGDTVFLTKLTVSHAASQSAGASVKTLVPFPKGPQGQVYLPAKYAVTVTPDQPAVVSVVDKSDTGFTIILTPLSVSTVLATGTFDVVIIG